MSRRPSAFRQADIAKAARAATSAGLDIGRIEVAPDGKIVLVMGKGQVRESNPFDDWMAKHARQA